MPLAAGRRGDPQQHARAQPLQQPRGQERPYAEQQELRALQRIRDVKRFAEMEDHVRRQARSEQDPRERPVDDARQHTGRDDDPRDAAALERAVAQRVPRHHGERGDGPRHERQILHRETERLQDRHHRLQCRIERRVAPERREYGDDDRSRPEQRFAAARRGRCGGRRQHHDRYTDVGGVIERFTLAVERVHPRQFAQRRVEVVAVEVRHEQLDQRERMERPEIVRLRAKAADGAAPRERGRQQLNRREQAAGHETGRHERDRRKARPLDARGDRGVGQHQRAGGGERHRLSRERLKREHDGEERGVRRAAARQRSIDGPEHVRDCGDRPRQVREISGGRDRPRRGERNRSERRRRRARAVTAEEEPGAERRQRNWQRDPHVEADQLRQQQSDRERDRMKDLIQRVVDGGLPSRGICVPERELSPGNRMPEPQVARAKRQRQIAHVEDVRQREYAGHGHEGDDQRDGQPCARMLSERPGRRPPHAHDDATSVANARTRRLPDAHHTASPTAVAALSAAPA